MNLRESFNKYVASRIEDGIDLFCIVVPNEMPHWLGQFIEQQDDREISLFPESKKSIHEQAKFVTELLDQKERKIKYVITQAAFIISDFDRLAVFVAEGSKIEPPSMQTFGASVNKITMRILGRYHTVGDLSKTYIESIHKKAEELNDPDLLDKIINDDFNNKLGESVELTLLVNFILNKIDKLRGKNETKEQSNN